MKVNIGKMVQYFESGDWIVCGILHPLENNEIELERTVTTQQVRQWPTKYFNTRMENV